jgi:hypothetical protein
MSFLDGNPGSHHWLCHSWHRIIGALTTRSISVQSGPFLPNPRRVHPGGFKTNASIAGLGSLRRQSFPARCASATLLAGLFVAGVASGQQPGQTRIPKINKIRGSNTQQAFTGKVQSVDIKHKVLNLKAEEGAGAEIFPLKKNLDIETASGEKLALGKLKPGSDVMIYYELKDNERNIKQIILLSPGSKEVKKKTSPPS